jgi:hypothetical protein
MTAQLDMFAPCNPTPAAGLRVRLPDVCKCGADIALIGAGRGPHQASLHCDSCGRHRGWVSKTSHDFLTGIIKSFGCPTEPIVIRRGQYSQPSPATAD